MTYSLAFTGTRADSPATITNLTLSDPQAVAGGQALAMAQGTSFLCRGPDGSQGYYKIDASRSLPGGPIYLLADGP